MLLNKNDDIELHIDSVSLTGSGVGRYNGLAVFVPATAPGDIIEAHIIKAKKSYAVGKCIKIIKPSPDRTGNDCPAYPGCGGCSFRHMSYDAELKLKFNAVRDAFSRIGGMDVELKPIIGADSPDGYRNKAQYPVGRENGKLKIGFYSRRSHRIVDCRACRLAPPEFEKILGTVADWIEKYNISVYDETSRSGAVRHIYLRKAFATGEIMLCLVSAEEHLPHTDKLLEALENEKSIKSVLININPDDTNAVLGDRCVPLLGDGCITDILCGVKVRISPLSFYQVNRTQAERLYKKAAEYSGDKRIKLLLDLYCGAGTIGLSMADRTEELIGIETVAPAIEDAKKNAAANGIENARFICADAGEAAERLLGEGKCPEAIVLDPPRKGCSEQTIKAAAGMAPDRIVYVSCDPATLARDCAVFKELGYEVKEATPVDLFPRTAHVETVAKLVKKGQRTNMRAIITDLDRTLLRTDKSISEYTLSVLEECRRRGILIMAASARPFRSIQKYHELIKFDALTTMNGAVVFLPHEILQFGISRESGEKILSELIKFNDISLSIETDRGLYSNRDIPEWKPIVYDGFPALPENTVLYKILASGNGSRLYKNIGDILTDDVYSTVAVEELVQIMSSEATKWNGIKKMLSHFGASPDDAVYFGDDNDDIESIANCATGVAVANAIPAVLKIADSVTSSNDSDGVARFIEENIL